jgi:putative SOS response-associated peptidase YedK
VPADGFYEWAGKTGDKQPYNVSRDGLFAFAGIWETAIGLDGGEADTVAILTTPSGADMRPVYAREPVVIEPEDYTLWLGADERDTAEINSLLHAAKKGTWTFRPVSKDVGNTRNDGPHLIEPATLL